MNEYARNIIISLFENIKTFLRLEACFELEPNPDESNLNQNDDSKNSPSYYKNLKVTIPTSPELTSEPIVNTYKYVTKTPLAPKENIYFEDEFASPTSSVNSEYNIRNLFSSPSLNQSPSNCSCTLSSLQSSPCMVEMSDVEE